MEKFKLIGKKQISKLPKSAGVYVFKDNEKFLYIGKAVNLRERIKQHRKLIALAEKIAYIKTGSETEALLLEAKLIKKHQPKYNVAWRDDKNYFYVGITEEEFPRVFITHQPRHSPAKRDYGGQALLHQGSGGQALLHQGSGGQVKYIGPFVNGRVLKQALRNLRKEFPYRTCKTLPKKPCLWHYLGQCPSPCLSGRQACLLKSQTGLLTKGRLEAYDISDIQGKQATGSMVTFINGKPDKNFYRRFKIKSIYKPNDVAMIKEVLSRRFRHPEWGLPDLILIDGGKAQLNAAALITKNCKVLRTKIKVIALAKKKNELYLEGRKNPIPLQKMPREIFNLILQARDEAHRFAKAYHHHLREKNLFI